MSICVYLCFASFTTIYELYKLLDVLHFPWDKESIHLQYIFPISGLTVDLNILQVQVQQSAVFESKQLV